jgi:hypothetical protein
MRRQIYKKTKEQRYKDTRIQGYKDTKREKARKHEDTKTEVNAYRLYAD